MLEVKNKIANSFGISLCQVGPNRRRSIFGGDPIDAYPGDIIKTSGEYFGISIVTHI